MEIFKFIKPMNAVLVLLCSLGILMGLAFPTYADYFVEWIPGRKAMFNIGCLAAGCIMGIFGYLTVKFMLRSIDSYYKKILKEKLGIDRCIVHSRETDTLLAMKEEFEELLDNFALLTKREKHSLQILSITDSLTSQYNHRYLFEYLEKKIGQGSEGLAVMFCDIDHFKTINDSKGHIIGDLALCEVSRMIKAEIGSANPVFRYGGDEFVAVMENVTEEQALMTAEKLRSKVLAAENLQKKVAPMKISISAGLAFYPEDGLEIMALIEKADRAMYRAKKDGRNRCCVYSSAIDGCIGQRHRDGIMAESKNSA